MDTVRAWSTEYSDELVVEQDLVLWLYVILNWVVLAAISFFTISSQNVEQETLDGLVRAFDIAIFAGVGIAFGRPLLIVAFGRILRYFGYEVDSE